MRHGDLELVEAVAVGNSGGTQAEMRVSTSELIDLIIQPNPLGGPQMRRRTPVETGTHQHPDLLQALPAVLGRQQLRQRTEGSPEGLG